MSNIIFSGIPEHVDDDPLEAIVASMLMDINIAVESKSVEVYHNSVNLKEKPQSDLIIKNTAKKLWLIAKN